MPQNTDHTHTAPLMLSTTSRNALRRLLIAQRHAMTQADVVVQSANIHRQVLEVLAAFTVLPINPTHRTVALYAPYSGEPDVLCLAQQLAVLHPHMTLCLPVVMDKIDGQNQALQFAQWAAGEPLIADAYGIAVPAHKHWVTPTVILIPCVGYCLDTEAGMTYRLGYGGGYYDRTFAALRGAGAPVRAIGIAWRCASCVFESNSHDIAMDAMLLG